MPNNWKTYKLSDIGTIARGKSKHRPRDASHLYGGEFPFIQTGDVKVANHRLNCHSQTYSDAGLAQSKLWPKDTMCITIAANIAETAILNYPACFPDSIIGFIADKEKCDIDFVEYLMQHFKKEVQSHSIGSVQDNINLGTFERLNFLIPPLQEQKSIASILSAIDDKIENNLAINKTLEEMAMALYKHWFVDFGPFQEGEFVESELGRIPKGWEVKKIGEVIETLGGGTPSTTTKEYWEDGDILWYSPTDLTRENSLFSFDTAKKITALGLQKSSAKMFPANSLLMSSRATIGLLTINTKEACTNQGFITMLPNDKLTIYQLYFWVKDNMDLIISKANGSTFKEISKSNFRDLKIVVPNSIESFIEQTKDIFEQIKNNTSENQTLTQLRDTLLPKLISGEVRLKEFRE